MEAALANSDDPWQQDNLYQPLEESTKEIRLLRIPRKMQDSAQDAPVRYTLFHAPLGEAGHFVALSYSWGTRGLTRKVNVNGKTAYVTESLDLALQSIQSDDSDVTLWADAICINQDDPTEKTSQVQMMRQIYRSAREVIIWLGPSTPGTDCTMTELHKLGSQLLEFGLWELKAEHFLDWSNEDRTDSDAARTKRDVVELAADKINRVRNGEYPFWWIMSDLGKRIWFNRAWCIQECSNAQIATFRCGQQEVDYKCFWAVACFFSIVSSRALSGREFDPKVVWHSQMLQDALPWTILGIRRKYLTGRGQDLRGLLDIANVKDSDRACIDATDPRDKVYALLGIATDDAAKSIVADYTLSCEETYIMTARALLKHGHDDVLSLCRYRGICKDLPSWVPDWSGPLRKPWSIWHTHERLYNASGSVSPATMILNHETTLSPRAILRGVFVDTIEATGHEFRMGLDDKWDYTVVRNYLNDIATYLSQTPKYTDIQKREAEWRLPVGDTELTSLTNQMCRAKPISHMKAGYEFLKQVANAHEDETRAAGAEEILEKENQSCARYYSQMSRMYDSKPLLSLDGYVGVCPIEAKEGDKIVIFLGARVPYVVRKCDGHWMLVGEAHVYGIMDGEFMKGDSKVEEIVLE